MRDFYKWLTTRYFPSITPVVWVASIATGMVISIVVSVIGALIGNAAVAIAVLLYIEILGVILLTSGLVLLAKTISAHVRNARTDYIEWKREQTSTNKW